MDETDDATPRGRERRGRDEPAARAVRRPGVRPPRARPGIRPERLAPAARPRAVGRCSTWSGSGSASGPSVGDRPRRLAAASSPRRSPRSGRSPAPSPRPGPAAPAAARGAAAVARDLVASVARFNRRWRRLPRRAGPRPGQPADRPLQPLLRAREGMRRSARPGSPRGTSCPRPRLTRETLLAEYPPLPVPELGRDRGRPRPSESATWTPDPIDPGPLAPLACLDAIGLAAAVAVGAAGGRAAEFEVTFTAGRPPRPDLGAGLRDARPGRRRSPAEPSPGSAPTGSTPSRSSPSRPRTGSPASRSRSAPTPSASPARSTRSSPATYSAQAVVRLNPDTHSSATARGTPTGRSSASRVDPEAGDGAVALDGRQGRPAPAVPRDRPDQARRDRQPAPLGLPPPADQAPGGGDPARRRRGRDQTAGRSTSSPASAATTSWPRGCLDEPRSRRSART